MASIRSPSGTTFTVFPTALRIASWSDDGSPSSKRSGTRLRMAVWVVPVSLPMIVPHCRSSPPHNRERPMPSFYRIALATPQNLLQWLEGLRFAPEAKKAITCPGLRPLFAVQKPMDLFISSLVGDAKNIGLPGMRRCFEDWYHQWWQRYPPGFGSPQHRYLFVYRECCPPPFDIIQIGRLRVRLRHHVSHPLGVGFVPGSGGSLCSGVPLPSSFGSIILPFGKTMCSPDSEMVVCVSLLMVVAHFYKNSIDIGNHLADRNHAPLPNILKPFFQFFCPADRHTIGRFRDSHLHAPHIGRIGRNSRLRPSRFIASRLRRDSLRNQLRSSCHRRRFPRVRKWIGMVVFETGSTICTLHGRSWQG